MDSKPKARYEISSEKENKHPNKVSFIQIFKDFLKNRLYYQKILKINAKIIFMKKMVQICLPQKKHKS